MKLPHRFRETDAVGTTFPRTPRFSRTMHRFRETDAVGTTARDTLRVHRMLHRFRETDAVGTTGGVAPARAFAEHRFRETDAVGTIFFFFFEGIRMAKHRFRETDAVGTISLTTPQPLRRMSIASERPTLLAQYILGLDDDATDRHRFRETDAVGTMLAIGSSIHSVEASLPRDRRCWHNFFDVHRRRRRSRIASERPTLLAQRYGGDPHERLLQHRFRETDAVGTTFYREPHHRPLHGIASERPTLLAQQEIYPQEGDGFQGIASERPTLLAQPYSIDGFCIHGHASLPRDRRCWHNLLLRVKSREVPASLPRDRRCWHNTALLSCHSLVRRIASERPTLLARDSAARGDLGQGRIASERPTLLARGLDKEIAVVDKVASLPRDRRCWHGQVYFPRAFRLCRIASERPTLLAREYSSSQPTMVTVASLPRDRRCWHNNVTNGPTSGGVGHVASEISTPLRHLNTISAPPLTDLQASPGSDILLAANKAAKQHP